VVQQADSVIRCPACGGLDVRRSYARGIFDAFMSIFHKAPFRCRGCSHRFYRYVEPKDAAVMAGGKSAPDDKPD